MFSMQVIEAKILPNNSICFLVAVFNDRRRVYPLIFNGRILDEYSVIPENAIGKIEKMFIEDFGNGEFAPSFATIKQQLERKRIYQA